MSLYSALYSGVSGLSAYSTALGVISDNITNVNTVGYKATNTEFSTLVTESAALYNYSPGGVAARPRSLIGAQGLLQSSNSATDLSIDGAGFFVVKSQPTGGNGEGEVQFTRAGSFRPDSLGFLRNTAGLYLMGWPLDSDGAYQNNGSLNELQPISTAGLTGTAEPTSSIRIRANLDRNSIPPSQVTAGTYDPASATNMANGTVQPNFSRDITIYDAQGGEHTVTLAFAKTPTPNEWRIEVYGKPPSSLTSTAPLRDGQIATGTVRFNGDGSLNIPGSSPSLFAPMAINWTGGSTASSITVNWGVDGEVNGLTQFGSQSALISQSVDGARFGNVTGVSVSNEGIVTALFDNGLKRPVYRLPVATFQNPDGLARLQGNAYGVSDFSGRFALVEAGTGGGGFIAPSTLEASTVDLASEFTKLITTQRAFSASTKVITTADEMLTELNQVRR
jgi:flagellar hook protein FlgE